MKSFFYKLKSISDAIYGFSYCRKNRTISTITIEEEIEKEQIETRAERYCGANSTLSVYSISEPFINAIAPSNVVLKTKYVAISFLSIFFLSALSIPSVTYSQVTDNS